MLTLKPTCENCGVALAANDTSARICSYECTFCATCVDHVLFNVCPNCGGGFVQRPIRPRKSWVAEVGLEYSPASQSVVHHPVDADAHAAFAAEIRTIPPHQR